MSLFVSQVGVGSLLVAYSLIGAFSFIAIEGEHGINTSNMTLPAHDAAVLRLWHFAGIHNINNRTGWKIDSEKTLHVFQDEIVEAIIKEGYENQTPLEIWNFPAALMYCLTVFTMIGYGHMTPRTMAGKMCTISYAVFGIPLYIVYFMNMGRVFAKVFKFIYRSFYRCLTQSRRISVDDSSPIFVPSTACIWVIVFYIVFGTVMFAEWEQWTYLDSCYFTCTSLAKIGIGDIVPGIGLSGNTEGYSFKLIANFVYLLFGMGIIAMCYTLMKEEFLLKMNALHQEFKDRILFIALKLGWEADHEAPSIRPRDPKLYNRSIHR